MLGIKFCVLIQKVSLVCPHNTGGILCQVDSNTLSSTYTSFYCVGIHLNQHKAPQLILHSCLALSLCGLGYMKSEARAVMDQLEGITKCSFIFNATLEAPPTNHLLLIRHILWGPKNKPQSSHAKSLTAGIATSS